MLPRGFFVLLGLALGGLPDIALAAQDSAESAAPPFKCVPAPEETLPSLPPGVTPEPEVNALPDLCPKGQVPQPIGKFRPKRFPISGQLRSLDQGGSAAAVSYTYYYALGYIIGCGTATSGCANFSAEIQQADPKLVAPDYHTLGQIGIYDTAPGLAQVQNTVEMGWTVDQGLNGDLLPHLFVDAEVAGTYQLYNGYPYHQVSKKLVPGMKVKVGITPHSYAFKYSNNKWWVGYLGYWIGYYPETAWTSAKSTFTPTSMHNDGLYSQSGFTWYGEVAAGSLTPCTQMGTGLLPSQSGSALMQNVNRDGVTIKWPFPTQVTQPTWYDMGANANGVTSFYWGGPGAGSFGGC